MKKIKYSLLMITVMIVTTGIINAQEVKLKADTATAELLQQKQQVQEQSQSQTQEQDKNKEGAQNQEQAGSQNQAQAGTNAQAKAQDQGASATGVKKVQSARPDWSKSRGARPASVERPSGSRIPKGAGKPGGAKGPGKR
jgi:hypothetical protein